MKLGARQRFILSIGVLLVAAGLRLWGLTETPPGLYQDEAFHLLQAQQIIRGEALPVFITGNNGYEPLFVYLAAIPLLLLGPVAWAGRLMAAWIGLLSVALTIRAGTEMFPRRSTGLLAGVGLAGLFWSLTFSRFGSQPILASAAAAGTLAAFWHGARTQRPWAFVLAGVSLGLGLDGYLGFRLFPFVALVAGLALLAARREQRLKLFLGGLLAASVALLIFAPLGIFFLQNPQWFFHRFDQTTATTLGAGDPTSALSTNLLKTVGGLFVSGDGNWRHNFAGRPALDAAQALFFLIGVGACAWRWREPTSWALGAWLAIGLSPTLLTYQAPHFGRTTMAIPAVALLIAVGITTLWEWTKNRAVRALVLVALALSTSLTLRDFWGRWAQDFNLFEYFEVQQSWIARALQAAPADAQLYATPLHIGFYYELWPIEYLLGPAAYRRFASFNGQVCHVIPSQTTTGATYAVIAPDDADTPALLQAAYPAVTHYTAAYRDGRPYVEIYQLPSGQTAQLAVSTSRPGTFGDLAKLVGYTLAPGPIQPGGTLQLQVVWQALRTSPSLEAYKIFVHLIGVPKADGNILYTQHDAEPCADTYPTWQWHPGDWVMEAYTLALPDDLPAGSYTLQMGWYNQATGQRLPVTDEADQPLGDALPLEHIQIGKP